MSVNVKVSRSIPLSQDVLTLTDQMSGLFAQLDSDAADMGVELDWGSIDFDVQHDWEQSMGGATRKYAYLTTTVEGIRL